ncbi:hypothetical protein E1815_20670 [Klebsiella pneumoniae]|nr:hypothetical protein E1815_20670 [Klebsiella pneumoniae]
MIHAFAGLRKWQSDNRIYNTRRPTQAQRRRAIAAGTEPLLCRAAADALPGLRSVPFVAPVTRPTVRAICSPGKRSATGEIDLTVQ